MTFENDFPLFLYPDIFGTGAVPSQHIKLVIEAHFKGSDLFTHPALTDRKKETTTTNTS